jgi:hypothetical protein
MSRLMIRSSRCAWSARHDVALRGWTDENECVSQSSEQADLEAELELHPSLRLATEQLLAA